MKNNIRKIFYSLIAVNALLLTSCSDYLDKQPESDINMEEAFKNFNNFQGFVEEMYNCIPDFAKNYWTNSWNWGEDEIMPVGIDYHMVYKIDQGDFWGWQREHDGWGAGWMDKNAFNPGVFREMSLWRGAWYSIRKANIGLANLDLLTDATPEQKRIIEGQLRFFRAWFHFELIQYFGGLPYVDEALPGDQKLTLPRLSYHEIADRCAEDFRMAAELLPINWDNTDTGRPTMGNNDLRINKIMALCYLGKNYLWAASPLMNKVSTGSATYNQEYADKAAQAFGEVLSLVENGKTQYSLVDYSNISDVFYTYSKGAQMPGSTEAIFRGPSWDGWFGTSFGPGGSFGIKAITNADVSCHPTANYVNYYGMANGLPLDDPESGFDRMHPWKDRDPRFYNDIKYDGCNLVSENFFLKEDVEKYRYADFQTGSEERDVIKGTRTGYLNYKFVDITCNQWEDGTGWSPQMHIHIPYMRLADVYLMYAESVAQATGNPSGSKVVNLSGVDAVNKIRRRAGVSDLNPKYAGNLEGFMSELRRERAVELSWEGHRFNDLRRWLLLDKYPYNIKTSQEFTRGADWSFDTPRDNQVYNFHEEVILTREFTDKHYWLPLKNSDSQLYLEFQQNPGW